MEVLRREILIEKGGAGHTGWSITLRSPSPFPFGVLSVGDVAGGAEALSPLLSSTPGSGASISIADMFIVDNLVKVKSARGGRVEVPEA